MDQFTSHSIQVIAWYQQSQTEHYNQLFSNHVIYAGDKLYEHLAQLMTAILIHGYQPRQLRQATILSIPKDARGDLDDDANYRGIAMMSSIAKIYDVLFLMRNDQRLATSDMQFSFKKQHGTTMCSMVLKEVIHHYLVNGSFVASCFIDSSKAFDLVRHDKLFELLLQREIPALDIRAMLNLYMNLEIFTERSGYRSSCFRSSNGIRQGGIASPLLYCVYIDELICRLEKAGTGCWIGKYYFGAFGYADDLSLICPTFTGLQKMLHICEQYAAEFSVKYNATKSMCMLFTRSKNQHPPSVTLNGFPMKWVTEIKHLGNYLSHDLNEASEIQHKRCDLIGRVNSLLGNMSGAPIEVMKKVFLSDCCHFYGCEAWIYKDQSIDSFHKMWNRCVRRLLKLPYRTRTKYLPHLIQSKTSDEQICERFVSLLISMLTGPNTRLNFIANRGIHISNTLIGENISYIKNRLDSKLRNCNVFELKKHICFRMYNDNDYCTIQAIKELSNCEFLNENEKTALITFLCVN